MKILIVDDSRSVRLALRELLEEAGYEVVEARDGFAALACGEKECPDCITMDVQMPDMNGFEATARIRDTAWGRRLPIIFVTNFDSLADREKGFALGATEFISKNTLTSWKHLRRAVDRLLKPEGKFEGVTILVVGGDEDGTMQAVECLRRQGSRILEAASAGEAMAVIREQGPALDMVVSQWTLPDMRSDVLCSQICQKEGRTLPFVTLRGGEDRDYCLNFFAAGGTDYVVKPFVKEEFVARVGVHLETRLLIKELSRNVEDLERLSRVRDGFLAITSHDLKSPLNSIFGYSQLLIADPNVTEKHRKWLSTMLQSAEFMRDIINGIVELGRSEDQSNTPLLDLLAVLPMVKVAISTLQQQALAKRIILEESVFFNGEPVIRGDRTRFLRILNNLLSNAIKFTPHGGRVTLAVDHQGKDILISVSDTGIGIPADLLSGLFDRYTKLSRPGTAGEVGTGLGMSITRQLVEQHNGTIEVTSEEGKGTAFRLIFPLAEQAIK